MEFKPASNETPSITISDSFALRRNNSNPDISSNSFYKELKGLIPSQKIVTSIDLPLDAFYSRLFKRTVDILLSVIIILFVLSWLIPILALLIKLDSKGPVFFLQKRNKKDAEVFTCIKLRSMVVNAEADRLPASDYDKRITALGRFLRTHYLDELPQFFNVLWGDMSIIGPRPHMISDNMKYEELLDYYSYRYKVKPGITGLAQVLGCVGSTADVEKMRDRMNLDIFYIRHWSAILDTKIIYRTARKIAGL
jgi:putative colanic acid biosynthesis UDP-glucose lipid carrier transferase